MTKKVNQLKQHEKKISRKLLETGNNEVTKHTFIKCHYSFSLMSV